ncbi:Flp pilus assembly protein CpaB [Jannaschia sp. R86511]|uniref:Flp pilus assembly protein CpaB n=1 Tax=Jannaschia sp. R86511 TaxID=3093853 RepID=UPI0036D401C8
MVGRVIVLVTAVLVAVAGVALVVVYSQRTVEAAEARLEPVPVLVVQQQVTPGTTVRAALAAGALRLADRPRGTLPAGYLQDADDVLDQEVNATLLPNEVLVGSRLREPGTSDGLAIEPDELAVTLPFGDPNRVARFVEPGDLVAVFLTQQAGGEDGTANTQLLLPGVRVIGVGSQTAPGQAAAAQEADQSLVTVSVLQDDAQRLILAQSLGELYLALLTEGEGQSLVETGRGVSAENLFRTDS